MSAAKLEIEPWLDYFDSSFEERSIASRLSALGVLSGAHVLLLGPPGTAKSMLARSITEMVGGDLFSTLLSRFSTPEDVFGPLSLPALEEGRYERLFAGYLPAADVAFVDEIYKANASILNSLLSVLNEGTFFNGNQRIDIPLRAMIAASNEVPEDDEGLDALDDRLLLRIEVEPIQSAESFVRVMRGSKESKAPKQLELASIDAMRQAAESVLLPDDIALLLVEVRRRAQQNDLAVSDRRYKNAVDVMRVMSALDGRQEIAPSDLSILRYVLWRHPDDQQKLPGIMTPVLEKLLPSDNKRPALNDLLRIAEDLESQADSALSESHNFFTEDGKQKLSTLLHKCLELGGHSEAWARSVGESMADMGGLWAPFWEGSAGAGALKGRVYTLLDHDLFVRILPNVDGGLSRQHREEGGKLRALLDQAGLASQG
jgi:MoxR-like ATPase